MISHCKNLRMFNEYKLFFEIIDFKNYIFDENNYFDYFRNISKNSIQKIKKLLNLYSDYVVDLKNNNTKPFFSEYLKYTCIYNFMNIYNKSVKENTNTQEKIKIINDLIQLFRKIYNLKNYEPLYINNFTSYYIQNKDFLLIVETCYKNNVFHKCLETNTVVKQSFLVKSLISKIKNCDDKNINYHKQIIQWQ